jgi:hypothetical protein
MLIRLGEWFVVEIANGGAFVKLGKREAYWSRAEGFVRG